MNDVQSFRTALLDWYDVHARVLPWRAPPGQRPDPYAVWLSEIMLQQTTVAAVDRYFRAFTSKWPRVEALASAADDEVMSAWAGLGYYARARNLLKCARIVASEHGGVFPDTEAGLAALPGIGPYTAAAIAAIAFDRAAVPVDGNVERVVARRFAVREALPGVKPRLRELAASFSDELRPGDFAQALMDLGATVCTPKRPDCARCPVVEGCEARRLGIAELLPAKAPRGERPVRCGVAFWVERGDGAVLLRRRPPRGLLGGMSEIPSSPWEEGAPGEDAALAHAPVHASWEPIGAIEHTFTHFHLKLDVWRGQVGGDPMLRTVAEPERCYWAGMRDLAGEALPSVMRKIVGVATRR